MEHLDDFIREQFQRDDPAGRFPFREDYWKQALPLIEAAERQRRRRRLLWWWFSGLFLLSGSWWGWQWSHQPATLDQSVSRQQSLPSRAVPDHATPGTTAGIAQPGPAVHSNPNSVSNPAEQAVALKNNQRPRFNTAVNQSSTPSKHSFILPAQPTRQKNDPSQTTAKGQMPAAQQSTINLPDPAVPLAIIPAAGAQGVPVSIVDGASTPVNARASVTAGSPAKSVTWQPMSWLSTSFQPLISGTGGFALALVPFNFPRIIPVHEPIFAIGLHASATFYRPAPSGRTTGATLGMYAEYWLRPAWSISAGLAWRKQPVTDTLITNAYQLRYRFGYEEETFRQEDRSLQVVEIPLGLHWHHRTWEIETGATFGRVLRVRAVQIQTSRSSLIPTPQDTEIPIKGQQNKYRQHYTGVFAGVGWQPLHRLQLEVRGTYRPAALLKINGENPTRPGGFWLDAGLRWQLFSNERIRIRR